MASPVLRGRAAHDVACTCTCTCTCTCACACTSTCPCTCPGPRAATPGHGSCPRPAPVYVFRAGVGDHPGPGTRAGGHHGVGPAAAFGRIGRRGIEGCGGRRSGSAGCGGRRAGHHVRRALRCGSRGRAEEQRHTGCLCRRTGRHRSGAHGVQRRTVPRGGHGTGQGRTAPCGRERASTVKDAPTPAVARSRASVCGLACRPADARLQRTYRPAAAVPNPPAAALEPACRPPPTNRPLRLGQARSGWAG